MNKNLKIILILIAILIVIAVSLLIAINTLGSQKNDKTSSENVTNETKNVITEEELAKARDEAVASKTETTRVKIYIGQYFSLLEAKDYQKMYDMLFDDFKNNYFKTEAEFEQYVENKYPRHIILDYIDIDREGYIYIITVKVMDGLNKSNSFNQRIVIRENGLNDFNISFQMD